MKYLNSMQNDTGKDVDVDGHTHTKSEISDMPTALSEFTNDIGAGGGIVIIVSATEPAAPNPGDFWYKVI